MRTLLVVGLLLSTLSAQAGEPAWQKDFWQTLDDLNKTKYYSQLPLGDIGGRESVARGHAEPDKAPALFQLWILGKDADFIELRWWHGSERPIRALILALFYCSHTEPTSDLPIFDGPFSKEEEANRGEEIDFVLKNRKAIATHLADTIKQRVDAPDRLPTDYLKTWEYLSTSDIPLFPSQ